MSGLPPIPPRPVSSTTSSVSDLVPPPPRTSSLPVFTQLPLLADGTRAQSGVLTPAQGGGNNRTTRTGIKWQASGPLWAGNGLDQSQCTQFEKCCWTASLGGPGLNVDEKGRQRTEILSWPPAKAGETWIYKWKYHLSSSSQCPSTPCPSGQLPDSPPCPPHRVCSSSKFFHLVQILSREQGGFIVALSLANDRIHIGSQLKPTGSGDNWKKGLPSVERERFEGRTTFHRVQVTWGLQGSVHYTVHGLSRSPVPCQEPPELLIDYQVEAVNVPALGSIKTGLYRAFVPEKDGECSAAFGDFDFFRKS